MEKKYQVFVSSTYEDLQEERKKVMEALLQMNCFPVGMEYFNASDSSQWEVIKSLIRECDYYVLIVAGRYGSVEKESGKSYTQKEFEYAIEQGVPVISFVHKNPENIPQKYVETDSTANKLFCDFKTNVKEKLCKFWDNADGLAAQVVLSLTSLIKTYPRVGWVKADIVSSAEADREILALRKENEELLRKIDKIQINPPVGSDLLQQGEDIFCIHLVSNYYDNQELKITWNRLFTYLSPMMINEDSELNLLRALKTLGCRECNLVKSGFVEVLNDDFYTIIIQLSSLGLIIKSERNRAVSDNNTYWSLTPYGHSEMVKLKALKK